MGTFGTPLPMQNDKTKTPMAFTPEEEEFAQLFTEGVGIELGKPIRRGEIVQGRVVSISNDSVFIDLGGKAEGVIDVRELADEHIKEGDVIEATVVSTAGGVRLSQKLTVSLHSKAAIAEAFELGLPVEGKVTAVNKGGCEVAVAGQTAFVPFSHMSFERVEDTSEWVDQVHRFKVIEYVPDSRRIVLSRTALIREERAVLAERFWDEVHEGQVITGTVTSIQEYGCFVDVGGVDGLVHLREMMWGRVGHPSDLVHRGQEVTVTVLNINREEQRVGLSMKSADGDPWKRFGTDVKVGDTVTGEVTRVERYGVFVEVLPGLEGLAHVSELTFARRVRHPSEIVSVGDRVDVVILDANEAEKRLSLSMKQVHEDPWTNAQHRYPVGTTVGGIIENVERFGVFVTVEEGITALIPFGEMDIDPNRDPTRLFKEGESITAAVIAVEPKDRKMTLSQTQVALNKETADVARWQADNKGRHGMGTFADLFQKTDKKS
jgi:small subunit ribosomal protein S1